MNLETTKWQQLVEIIDRFETGIGFSIANAVGHLVLEGCNLDDHNIDFQIAWTESHRSEMIANYMNPKEANHRIDAVIAFLQLLKCVPEEKRKDPRWHDDSEVA